MVLFVFIKENNIHSMWSFQRLNECLFYTPEQARGFLGFQPVDGQGARIRNDGGSEDENNDSSAGSVVPDYVEYQSAVLLPPRRWR